MNFQKMQTVGTYEFYLDIAFRNAKKRIAILKIKKIRSKDPEARLRHTKYLEIERVKYATKMLTDQLTRIHMKFPLMDEFPEFYIDLAKITIDYGKTKKSLATVKWAVFQSNNQRANAVIEIKKARSITAAVDARKHFYGRISSIMKQISSSFTHLEKTRKLMKAWPDIKTEIHTVAIAGYPNVGKSSLLKALTGTHPEIKAYAFTTKRLNVGYFEIEPRQYQVIDTPGTFDRDILKMNNIEKQAFLVLQLLAEKIVYVFDPSESCGYSLKDQMNLFKRVQEKFKQPIIIVCNKVDLPHIKKNMSRINNIYSDVLPTSVTDEEAIQKLRKRIVKKEK